jgi:hypothetical protein
MTEKSSVRSYIRSEDECMYCTEDRGHLYEDMVSGRIKLLKETQPWFCKSCLRKQIAQVSELENALLQALEAMETEASS